MPSRRVQEEEQVLLVRWGGRVGRGLGLGIWGADEGGGWGGGRGVGYLQERVKGGGGRFLH